MQYVGYAHTVGESSCRQLQCGAGKHRDDISNDYLTLLPHFTPHSHRTAIVWIRARTPDERGEAG